MQTTVPVKSAWASKVNWLQLISLLATFLTGIIGIFNLDPMTTAKLTALVAMIGQMATLIVRTFFTTSVTSQSMTSAMTLASTNQGPKP